MSEKFDPGSIRNHVSKLYNHNASCDPFIHEYVARVVKLQEKLDALEEKHDEKLDALGEFETIEDLVAHAASEERWANYYCRKLIDAQREGYLPKDFAF